MATVYEINKGINRSLEFKGIKAQYLLYLAAGLVSLLLVFAILYMLGVSIYFCVGIVILAGAGLFAAVSHYSKQYGEHGLMKRAAKKRLPRYIQSSTRKTFAGLLQSDERNQTTTTSTTHL